MEKEILEELKKQNELLNKFYKKLFLETNEQDETLADCIRCIWEVIAHWDCDGIPENRK